MAKTEVQQFMYCRSRLIFLAGWVLSWVVVLGLQLVLSSAHGASSGRDLRSSSQRVSMLLTYINRGGAGPRGFLATLSQYMLSSAATFSFFLAIGSVGFPPPSPSSPSKHHDIVIGHPNGLPYSPASTSGSDAIACSSTQHTIKSGRLPANEG